MGILLRWAGGISLWMLRGRAAELMQHSLTPAEGQRKKRSVKGGGKLQDQQIKLQRCFFCSFAAAQTILQSLFLDSGLYKTI